MALTPETILTRRKEILETQVDHDLVMMDESQGKYFGLNPVAKVIWEVLDQPKSYQNLLEFLTERYEVTKEKCAKDIEPFLSKMISNQLICISNA